MGRRAKVDDALVEATEAYDAGDKARAKSILTQVSNQFPGDPQTIGLLGTMYIDEGKPGVAISLLHRATELAPAAGLLWNNLAAAYMAAGQNDAAVGIYRKGLDISPDDADLLGNMGSVFSDSGRPHEALEWLDKALAVRPDHAGALWNKGLALLTLRRWREGWKFHETGDKNKEGARHVRDYQVPRWDGKAGQRVIVAGEQGLGDEIMYASCIPDLIEISDKVIFDCHPRLTTLWRRTFPELRVYGTRKEDWITWRQHEEADAWVSIGSLPSFFRNDDSDFPGTPYLEVNEQARSLIRRRFEQLGPPPYVGITWFGGRKHDRIAKRSVGLEDLRPVLEQAGTFISLQYDRQMADPHVAAADAEGLTVHHYPDVLEAYDYDQTVNYVAACDLVIGVTQTVNHVAGALGVPHWVLVGDRPSWREGIECDDMPWYSSLKLYRKPEGGEWSDPIGRVAEDFRAWSMDRIVGTLEGVDDE